MKHWSKITLSLLKDWGFNTFENWSDFKIASLNKFPYVRPLYFKPKHVDFIFRDFPDVFSPDFENDVNEYAKQLEETKNDPSLIGYFLMNEPTWGFAKQLPAEGMLISGKRSKTREKLCNFLRKKYNNSESLLSSKWKIKVSFNEIKDGKWKKDITESAKKDLEEFSTIMVKKLFEILSFACKKIDPNHLNLGARYYTVPPEWVIEGMRCFDVFSINCYSERVPKKLEEISKKLNVPILIGEWHFGALDVGLPASGIGRVKNQKEEKHSDYMLKLQHLKSGV